MDHVRQPKQRIGSSRQAVPILLLCTLLLGLLVYLSAAHPKPWTSFVPDLDKDGFRDVAQHSTIEECTQHIRALHADGICGLQCNQLSNCVKTVRVFGAYRVQSPVMGAATSTH